MGSAGERISGKQIPQKPVFNQQISKNVTGTTKSVQRHSPSGPCILLTLEKEFTGPPAERLKVLSEAIILLSLLTSPLLGHYSLWTC